MSDGSQWQERMTICIPQTCRKVQWFKTHCLDEIGRNETGCIFLKHSGKYVSQLLGLVKSEVWCTPWHF
jgi:hypothetical protein